MFATLAEFGLSKGRYDARIDDGLTLEGAIIVNEASANSKFNLQRIASNMIAWFSQRYTVGENAFSVLIERQRIGANWGYRSRQSTFTSPSISSLLTDTEVGAFEGQPKLVAHIQRERDSGLVASKLSSTLKTTGRLACECCGFDAKRAFPNLDSPIVEVHHCIPLSNFTSSTKTKLEDLAVLCPTCHRAIHRAGCVSIHEFSLMYFSSQSQGKVESKPS